MPELIRLRQHLSKESHGGHLDNGASKLLSILVTIDEIGIALEEQERWLRDSYTLSDHESHELADEAVQTFLSTLMTNVADFGEDYLINHLCADDGFESVAEALKRWQESHAISTHPTINDNDALGDLDEHPF